MVSSTLDFSSAKAVPATPGVRRALNAVWRGLEAIGQHRASRCLLDIADAYADAKPEFAQQMRLASRRRGAV